MVVKEGALADTGAPLELDPPVPVAFAGTDVPILLTAIAFVFGGGHGIFMSSAPTKGRISLLSSFVPPGIAM